MPDLCWFAILPLSIVAFVPAASFSLAAGRVAVLWWGVGVVLLARSFPAHVVRAIPNVAVAAAPVALAMAAVTDWQAQKVPAFDPLYAVLVGLPLPTLVHPNMVGGLLAMWFWLVVGAVATTGGPRRWAGGVSAAVLVTLLALTASRAAIVGILGGVVAIAGVTIVEGSSRLRAGAVLGAGVAVASAAGIFGLWAAAGGGDSSSFSSRVELWQRSVVVALDFAATGVGPGQFDRALRLYPLLLTPVEEVVPHAHNGFLQVILDWGILAAAALGLALVATGVELVRRREDVSDGLRPQRASALAGLVAFAVYSLADAISFGSRGAPWLWLGLAIISALACRASSVADPRRSS